LNNAITYATIIASKNDDSILAFATSDNEGKFKLVLSNDGELDSLWVTVRHLSYETKRFKLNLKTQQLEIVLLNKKNELSEVVVNSKKKVTIDGDTIRYTVDTIKKIKDYTIEEVIDRIPGVSIADNGQIRYKNRPISHLYINGVDLLEGRYNIATRGIPSDAVKDIEIIRNHNHARIDKGVTASNDVAFNIKIKNDRNLIFGSTKGDVGLPLLTARAEVTPILIKDNIQDIASLKANNIGRSLRFAGANLTSGNFDLSQIKINDLQILNPPNTLGNGLKERTWLNNESFSIINDVLVKSEKNKIFKVGLSFNNEVSQLHRASLNSYFFGNDSTLVDLRSSDVLKAKTFYLGLVNEINEEKIYLKNKLVINGKYKDGRSLLVQNTRPQEYDYDNRVLHLKDELEFKTLLGKRILDSGFIVEYLNQNENSQTLPKVFNGVIPGDSNADETTQDIDLEQFNIGAFSSYKFDIGKTEWLAKQRLNYRNEFISTRLSQGNQADDTAIGFPFQSEFKLKSFNALSSLFLTYRLNRFTLNFGPQLEFIRLDQKEKLENSINRNDSYLFFQPKVNLAFKLNQKWNAGYGFKYKSEVSRFAELIPGIILRDFATLTRNPNEINVTRKLANDFFIGYNDILRGFFINNTTSFERNISDFTFVSIIDDNGLLATDAIKRPNRFSVFTNTVSITKRFFQILSTDISYSYSEFDSEQVFNGVVQRNKNISHNIQFELDLDNETWYGLNYIGSFNFGESRVDSFKTSNTFLNHNLQCDIYMSKRTRFNFGSQTVYTSFRNSNVNTIFNASFFYKASQKLFFRAELLNLFNEENYDSVTNSSNFTQQSRFSLRPRQFTIGINYTL
jgi:hypothetical protein